MAAQFMTIAQRLRAIIDQRHSIALLLLCWLAVPGCSTLGISLYPATSALTTESKAVLDGSRIPAGIPRENAMTVLPPHALQPGDAILVEPLQFDRDLRLPADQIVLADGTIDLGPFGRLVVVGHTLEQVETLIEHQITAQLREQQLVCQTGTESDVASQSDVDSGDAAARDCDSLAINVRLLEPAHQFYVLGEVNAPGSFPLTGDETVLDAIVGAGGLTSSANPCQILLARPTDPNECRVTLPVCYREIVQMGNTATNYQLQPGDRIFVPSRSCLDELMFWRASRSCERCCGCNQPCRNPSFVTFKPMSKAADTLIPPGSKSWTTTDPQALGEVESTAPILSDIEDLPVGFLPDDSSMPFQESLGANQGNAESDVDGQLAFPSR